MDDETTAILDDICSILASDKDYPLDKTLLYARVDTNMVAASVYKDLGDHVLWREYHNHDLQDALLDLWEAAPVDQRWAVIEYFVQNGKFNAVFTYSNDINHIDGLLDCRQRVIEKYYGEKPAIYPSLKDYVPDQ